MTRFKAISRAVCVEWQSRHLSALDHSRAKDFPVMDISAELFRAESRVFLLDGIQHTKASPACTTKGAVVSPLWNSEQLCGVDEIRARWVFFHRLDAPRTCTPQLLVLLQFLESFVGLSHQAFILHYERIPRHSAFVLDQ